jgi:hypothetical protein
MFPNFKFKKSTEPTDLEIEIERLLAVLKDTPPTEDNYDKVSEQYVKLTKLNSETTSKKRVSPDVLAGAATNLFGILLILNYEHAHVFTSKAASFVVKNFKS